MSTDWAALEPSGMACTCVWLRVEAIFVERVVADPACPVPDHERSHA